MSNERPEPSREAHAELLASVRAMKRTIARWHEKHADSEPSPRRELILRMLLEANADLDKILRLGSGKIEDG